MSELRSLSLEAALIGAVVTARISRMPLPSLAGGAEALSRAAETLTLHVPSFRRRPSGLWAPAAPGLIGAASVSAGPGRESGPAGGTGRPGAAQDLVDLDGLVAFLRRRHPAKTAYCVAAATGESSETVRKWLKRETRPGFRATLVLVCVYGLPLIEACVRRRPGWLDEATAETGRHAIAAQLAALRPLIVGALA